MAITCELIPDRLARYHPYSFAYRVGASRLYTDFSPYNPREREALLAAAAAFHWPGDRAALSSALLKYLTRLQAPRASLENAARIARPNALLVATGHQPGLFGGPLFLAFKILTVLRLCSLLNEPQGERVFIPVFWNASEDHNPAEFSHASVLDERHDLVHLSLPSPEPPRMAERTPATEAKNLLGRLGSALPDTEFRMPLIETLSGSTGEYLGESASRLFLEWFGQEGLVVLEPHLFRREAQPWIGRALGDWRALHECIAADTRAMEEQGIEPLLKLAEPERTLVYYVNDTGGRNRIRVSAKGGGFAVEQTDLFFPGDSIQEEIEKRPERFSPSAALRPVLQGALLPVIAYVAGGGEIAYHFQLRRLFRHLKVSMPLLVPRAAGTILKPPLHKTMERLGLSASDLLAEGWAWEELERSEGEKRSTRRKAFERFRSRADEAFVSLSEALSGAGRVNLNELQRERDRFLGRLEGLERRFHAQFPSENADLKRQYYRLRKFVLPSESYQDLSVWTVYFLCLFGPGLLREMLGAIDPFSDRHHVFSPR
ncbi:MAG: bacillithiol biosynthesis cysteine-adding enzyme BshC [Planctomycetota bacterium]